MHTRAPSGIHAQSLLPHAPYKDALKLLISKLRRDLKRPDMNIVIGRISDAALDRPSWVASVSDIS